MDPRLPTRGKEAHPCGMVAHTCVKSGIGILIHPWVRDLLVMPLSSLEFTRCRRRGTDSVPSPIISFWCMCDGIKELLRMELTWDDEPSIDQDLFKNLGIIFSLSLGLVYVSFWYADLCCVFCHIV